MAKKPAKQPPEPHRASEELPGDGKPKQLKPVRQATPKKTEAPKTTPRQEPVRSKPAAKKRPLAVPPILLEGDNPPVPGPSGPGQRYALGPTQPVEHFRKSENLGELPESYGTERMLLTARDPHWLYASWDLTRAQLASYNALSVDGHLIVRPYVDSFDAQPIAEIHVHPESREWFVPVEKAGAKYLAELGYRNHDGRWVRIAASQPTVTPPDTLAADTSVQFATIPPEVSFEQLLELVTSSVGENVPLVEAIRQLRSEGHPELPSLRPSAHREWTPAQAQALAKVVSMDAVRRVWMGSLEITELIRRQLQQEISSAAAGQFSLPTSPAGSLHVSQAPVSGISSPVREMERRGKVFWFNVNAEIVLYGATEPNAAVTIGERAIKLRPDGTFSYRFALPDGQYSLPIKAVSADGEDGRQADLHFGRNTQFRGDVGAHPQDSKLKVPSTANVA